MRNIVDHTALRPSHPLTWWALIVGVALLVLWTLGMMGVVHLALPLVWILPFTALVIGAGAILWDGGLFDDD